MTNDALSAIARRLAVCALSAAALGGCAARGAAPGPPASRGAASGALRSAVASGTPVTHVLVLVQENRSFDDLFYGYPGANTATSGINSQGKTVQLQPIPLEAPWNPGHVSSDFFAACDGTPHGRHCKNDAFDKETLFGKNPPANAQYAYVPHRETKPYFEIAHQYVLGDAMFPAQIDESFESHQYLIAATANHAVDGPIGENGCGDPSATVVTLLDNRRYGPVESPCFDSQTIGDELDAKQLPWRYYVAPSSDLGALWSAYRAISHIYNGPDWTQDVLTPSSRILKDVAKGKLAAVTWVTPTCATSDHAGCDESEGPDWVASVVNAVGESKFWNSTAIFVMWDEWGGWYDHVPPPYVDFDGYGMRVPLLIVSPYAKKNYVSHVQYEQGSILKFIEDTFGLAPLAQSDARATSPAADCFDFNRAPRPFTPIQTTRKSRDLLEEAHGPRGPQPGID